MRTIGVDPAFSDSKTKKCMIRRDMIVEVLEDGIAYLTISFKCPETDA